MLEVIPIKSCCAGLQFINFPGAHKEPGFGRGTDKKQFVINFLQQMSKNKGYSFFYAFINKYQLLGYNHKENMYYLAKDKQGMNGIFEVLGWKQQECLSNSIYLFTIQNPHCFINQTVLEQVPYYLSIPSNLEKNKKKYLIPYLNDQTLYDFYKQVQEQNNKLKEEYDNRDKGAFWRKMKELYNIERNEVGI